MPSDLLFKAVNRFQRTVQRVTFGRRGWSGMGMPMVKLTTTGRHSGEPRTVMLTSPLQRGDTIVVVASRWGDERNPGWLYNVRANPEVTVSTSEWTRRMRAREATEDERSSLWPLVIADHDNYAKYQRRTDRVIPVVLLEPADT